MATEERSPRRRTHERLEADRDEPAGHRAARRPRQRPATAEQPPVGSFVTELRRAGEPTT